MSTADLDSQGVLATLLQRPGQVVTREELRQLIWPEESLRISTTPSQSDNCGIAGDVGRFGE
jgi:hypothetical protein